MLLRVSTAYTLEKDQLFLCLSGIIRHCLISHKGIGCRLCSSFALHASGRFCVDIKGPLVIGNWSQYLNLIWHQSKGLGREQRCKTKAWLSHRPGVAHMHVRVCHTVYYEEGESDGWSGPDRMCNF